MRYFLIAALLLACDAADPADPNGPPTLAEGVPVDTFIVMRHTSGIHLVDPATGKASATQPAYYTSPISAIEDGFAISPDGQRIAWVKTLGTVAVGQAKVVGGEPVLEIIKELPEVTYQGVKWSPDGDRLVTTHAVIDVDTWAVHLCPDDDPTGNPIVLNETLPVFPGSHRAICPDGHNLYDDGVFVGHGGREAAITTADGQLARLDLHVPSATLQTTELVPDVLWNRGDLPHFLLPDGKTLVPPGGGGESADDGYVYDLPAIFTSRVWARSAADRWFMKEALDPFLHEADAAVVRALALQDNGRAVVFRVTSQTLVGFPPELEDSDMAVVEVTRDGAARGFITSPLVSEVSHIQVTDRVYDLVGDDFLVAGWTSKDNGQEPHLVGYIGGEETHYRGFDTLTPDGRWFYGFRRYTPNPNEGGQHCFYDRKTQRATCFPQVSIGQPIGLMGQGVKPEHDGEAPAISGVSRTAAWPGALVVVFGAHFGTRGTLTLNGVTVAAEAWTPNQIRFRMPATGGVVAVSNDQGISGYREFHVGVSALIETPFSGMTATEVSVGQGLNVLALGDVPLEEPAFFPVGAAYAYLSGGASPARTVDVTLHAGGATRALRVHEEDRSADPGRWQIVADHPLTEGRDPRLATLAGLLVEERQARVPSLHGERVLVDPVDPRIFFGGGNERGLPDFWRNVPGVDAAWTASRFAENTNAAWSLRYLEAWESTIFGWRPTYATSPRSTLPPGMRGVAAKDRTVLVVGRDESVANAAGSFRLSTDGGLSFTAHDAGTIGPLREPLFVETAVPFFLVLEAEYAGSSVAFHAVGLDGTFTRDVLPALPAASLSQDPVFPSYLSSAQQAGKVALHFSNTHTAHLADFTGTATWTTLSDVRSIYHDADGATLYAVMLDGTIQRSTDWKTFTPVDLGIAFAIPLTATPYAIEKLDGRWVVIAKLFEPGGAPSALMRSAILVGPAVTP